MINNKKTIGIIGGVGPLAGADLFKKIVAHTNASKDQEHINTIMISCPSLIPDRTGFLLEGGDDPAPGIEKCFEILSKSGADAAGICCNTAHSPKILSRVKIPADITFINMIEKTCQHISEKYGTAKIGIIATLGTLKTGIYDEYFKKYANLTLVKPDDDVCISVQNAIYDKNYGIKANAELTEKAKKDVSNAVETLKKKGCKAVILGCTELPLVFARKKEHKGTELVDPTEVLAEELILATEPKKLI